MDKKEVIREIYNLVNQAEEYLSMATKLADDHNVSFYFQPAYGMGGDYENGSWKPSSTSC